MARRRPSLLSKATFNKAPEPRLVPYQESLVSKALSKPYDMSIYDQLVVTGNATFTLDYFNDELWDSLTRSLGVPRHLVNPMTEQEWLASDDPAAMLAWLTGRDLPPPALGKGLGDRRPPSDRKLRLFACACVRQAWDKLTDPRSRRAVEVAERYADRLVTDDELSVARDAAWDAAWDAARAVAWAVARAVAWDAAWAVARDTAWGAQAALLRDIVGNPYRPLTPSVPPDTCHRSDTWGRAYGMARAAYEDRRADGTLCPDRLAVLSDALEDAGAASPCCVHCVDGVWGEYESGEPIQCSCRHSDILRHLRGPVPHVRGCWVLDLLLGKE